MLYRVRFLGGPHDGEVRRYEFGEPPSDTLVDLGDGGVYLVTASGRLDEWGLAEATYALGATAERPRPRVSVAELVILLAAGAATGASVGAILVGIYLAVGWVVDRLGHLGPVGLAALAGLAWTIALAVYRPELIRSQE